MYGIMLIENISEQENKAEKMRDWKLEFKQAIMKYLEEAQIFYIESELDEILKFTMKKEFKKILSKKYEQWTEEEMIEICNIVKNITTS